MYTKSAPTAVSECVWLNNSTICFYTNKIHLDCWQTWRRCCITVRQQFHTSTIKQFSNKNVIPGSAAADITIRIHSEIWFYESLEDSFKCIPTNMCVSHSLRLLWSMSLFLGLPPFQSHSQTLFRQCKVTDHWTQTGCTVFTPQLLLSCYLIYTQPLLYVCAHTKSLQCIFWTLGGNLILFKSPSSHKKLWARALRTN